MGEFSLGLALGSLELVESFRSVCEPGSGVDEVLSDGVEIREDLVAIGALGIGLR
jgi:hypothetical protein